MASDPEIQKLQIRIQELEDQRTSGGMRAVESPGPGGFLVETWRAWRPAPLRRLVRHH
jgi:hypothetical protein